jgi:hypothetical protein
MNKINISAALSCCFVAACLFIFLINNQENLEIHINKQYDEVYNVGDLLCIHGVTGHWNNQHCYNNVLFPHLLTAFPGSIFERYMQSIDKDKDILPDIPKLQSAVDSYLLEHDIASTSIGQEMLRDDVLCVHIRSGDKGNVEDDFIEKVKKVAQDYKKVYLLSGIHKDTRFGSLEENSAKLSTDIEKVIMNSTNGPEYVFDNSEADTHLCMFRLCKNLMVHRGGYSMVATLLFQGNNLYLKHPFLYQEGENKWTTYLQEAPFQTIILS